MIQSPAGYQGDVRIKRYLDFYQAGYGVAMLSSGVAFSPLSLFAQGEQGGWYDPSDLTTLFQDAAGTTPVTAVEQPVGLVLDKSKGLVLGAELVTNGNFSGGSTGWTVSAQSSISGGQARIVSSDGTFQNISQNKTLNGPAWYELSVDIVSVTSGGLSFAFTGAGINASLGGVAGTKKYRFYISANTSSSLSFARTVGVTDLTIDNISVRELPGNHLSQSTSTARPVLRATSRIDYDGTDDKMTAASSGGGTTGFLFVAGINLDVTGANQTVWSDTGTNTGYRVRINSSNQLELSAGNGSTYTTAVTTETLSATTNYVIAAWHDGTNLNVKLGTGGATASQAFAAASAGTSGFTIGMDNGAVSSQLNGKLYNVVYVKNFAGSLSNVTNTIAYVNGTLT